MSPTRSAGLSRAPKSPLHPRRRSRQSPQSNSGHLLQLPLRMLRVYTQQLLRFLLPVLLSGPKLQVFILPPPRSRQHRPHIFPQCTPPRLILLRPCHPCPNLRRPVRLSLRLLPQRLPHLLLQPRSQLLPRLPPQHQNPLRLPQHVPRPHRASQLDNVPLAHRPVLRRPARNQPRCAQPLPQLLLFRAHSLHDRQCRPAAIAARFPAPFLVAVAPAGRVLASPCARKGRAAVRPDLVQVDRVLPEVKAVPGDNALALSRQVRAPAPVPLAVRRCFLLFQTKCRPRQSLESLFTRASLLSASGPLPTSGNWKANANCILPASAWARVVAA